MNLAIMALRYQQVLDNGSVYTAKAEHWERWLRANHAAAASADTYYRLALPSILHPLPTQEGACIQWRVLILYPLLNYLEGAFPEGHGWEFTDTAHKPPDEAP